MNRTICLLSMILTVFTSSYVLPGDDKPAVLKPAPLDKVIIEVAATWEKLTSVELSEEAIGSYIPEYGIRGKYAWLKNMIGIPVLEKLAGCPVFLKGPHRKGELDLKSMTEHGYYNPHFLNFIQKEITRFKGSAAGVAAVKTIYDKHLKKLVRVYFISYLYLSTYDGRTDIIQGYADTIKAATGCKKFDCSPSAYLQESFRMFAERTEKDGYNIYECFTAPAFWVRRSIDGTDKIFFEIIKSVMSTWDKPLYDEWLKK